MPCSIFNAILLSLCLLLGGGCTESAPPAAHRPPEIPHAGGAVDVLSGPPFTVRHPNGIWVFNVTSSQFWLREPDELPKRTPREFKFLDEPSTSDDYLFSVRTDGSGYYGFPYLKVRVIRSMTSSTAPIDYVLGDVHLFQTAGYPTPMGTLQHGDVLLRYYQRSNNELIFLTYRHGFVIIIKCPLPDEPQRYLEDIASLVRGFEVLP